MNPVKHVNCNLVNSVRYCMSAVEAQSSPFCPLLRGNNGELND